MAWIVRGLLFIGGVIASWFVAEDATNFPFVNFVATMLVFVLLVALVAFGGPLLRWLRHPRKPHD